MITLDKTDLIGKSHHREVYRHPTQHDLCIKIMLDGDTNIRQEKREIAYYKHLEKRGISWEMLSRYYEDVETTLGIGSVYDLILDHDGSVSKTMGYYIASNSITEENYDGLSSSLYLLKDYLLKNRILTMTLAHRNIVCQKSISGIDNLFVIDNIGNSDFIPVVTYIKKLSKKKIGRRWQRFEDRLSSKYPQNKALHRILAHKEIDS